MRDCLEVINARLTCIERTPIPGHEPDPLVCIPIELPSSAVPSLAINDSLVCGRG